MIIKLNEDYNNQLINYLRQEENFNLFLIGDIKRYGYDNYFFNIWANFDMIGNIKSLLIQYFDLLTLYSHDNNDVTSFIELINKLPYRVINGKIDNLKYI